MEVPQSDHADDSPPEPAVRRGDLLDELLTAYPELPAEAVVEAVERAHVVAGALGAGSVVTPARIAALARDRLDVLRTREAAEHRFRETGRAGTSGAGPEQGPAALPCTYCRGPVPAASFVYWSTGRQLLSAICPQCRRRVTVRSATWRRLRGSETTTGSDG